MLYKRSTANTSAIRQQVTHTICQLSSPSCSTRAIQKSLTPNKKCLTINFVDKQSGGWTISIPWHHAVQTWRWKKKQPPLTTCACPCLSFSVCAKHVAVLPSSSHLTKRCIPKPTHKKLICHYFTNAKHIASISIIILHQSRWCYSSM